MDTVFVVLRSPDIVSAYMLAFYLPLIPAFYPAYDLAFYPGSWHQELWARHEGMFIEFVCDDLLTCALIAPLKKMHTGFTHSITPAIRTSTVVLLGSMTNLWRKRKALFGAVTQVDDLRDTYRDEV